MFMNQGSDSISFNCFHGGVMLSLGIYRGDLVLFPLTVLMGFYGGLGELGNV